MPLTSKLEVIINVSVIALSHVKFSTVELLSKIMTRDMETYRMPPTSTRTSAAEMVVAAGKVLVSTTLNEPPDSCVPLTLENGYV